jgi:hypothetical protein
MTPGVQRFSALRMHVQAALLWFPLAFGLALMLFAASRAGEYFGATLHVDLTRALNAQPNGGTLSLVALVLGIVALWLGMFVAYVLAALVLWATSSRSASLSDVLRGRGYPREWSRA